MTNLLAEDLEHIRQHTAGLWEDLRGARLFLTGGTGFFGTWLLESAVWANRAYDLGLEVHVLSRNPVAFAHRAPQLASTVRLHEGDVRNFAFPPGSFTHVIHAATPTHSHWYEEAPEMVLDVIVQGMRRVLDFARAAGAPNPLDVRAVYAEGKRVAEQLGAIYHQKHGVHVSIARGFAFVGPHLPLDAHFAIGNFIRDGLRGGPIQVAGDGTPLRSYLHAADLAIWLWTILLRGAPCRPYNVGSEEDLSIAELARKVADYFHTDVRIARPPVAGAAPSRYVPCSQRAQRELGLRTWIGLDEALARTIRWQHSQRGT